MHDALDPRPPTGETPNAPGFHSRLQQAINDAGVIGDSGAVVTFGLDGFADVSAGLGRVPADGLLAAVGRRLEDAVAGENVMTRVGDDQFAVLIPPGSPGTTMLAVEHLRETVALPLRFGGHTVFRHASAGIAVVRPPPATAEDLLLEAQSAVAVAQLRGGDQVAIFDPRGHAGLQEDARLEVDLREALERDELTLVYQPIVDLSDGRIVGLEALVRWNHPTHGAVAAPRLVALAAKTALRGHLGSWVLRSTCREVSRWRAAGVDVPPVSVNVSTRELARPAFAEEALAVRRAAGLTPQAIVLELTGTTSSIVPADSLATVIDDLRANGFRVILDEFGSGSASLRHLEQFRVSGVKIDGAFIARLESDAYPRAVVAAVLVLGQSLGLRVIVDGVETAEQASVLRDLGCRQAQGWLFARPMTADRVPAALLSIAPMPGTAVDGTMSLGAAVDALGVSASTVRRRINEGHLSASRTTGGHRRLRRAEVERERRRTSEGPAVRAPQEPADRLPKIGAVLLERGAWIRELTLRYVYVGDDHGWFGTPGGRAELDRWLADLGGGLSSRDFEQVVAATSVMLAASRDAGVPLAERISLLDGMAQAARAALSGRQAGSAELRDWIRVGRVLRQLALLEGAAGVEAAAAHPPSA